MEETVQNQIIKLATIKLMPYKIFIKTLLKIEEQGIVQEKDYRKLRKLFQGHIMPFMKKGNLKKVAANMAAIGKYVGVGNENYRLREELQKPILAIVNIFTRDLGFGGKLDETLLKKFEKAEDEYFPRLFRQAVKEALDNVLVIHSDHCLFNRGGYALEKDGEYIIYTLINDHPRGCKIMIGPFANTQDTEILFKVYIPRYIQIACPELAVSDTENSVIDICIPEREMPLSVSRPLMDSCLIELEQEESYNGYIPSFSFDDMDSLAFCRRNYAEVAFALGQRVKYIFLYSRVFNEGLHLHEYIKKLMAIDPFRIYPDIPWELTSDGDMVI
ncbi:hypothetical protein R84B8_00781 [Treponema sp. R8-4-B8]